MLVRHRAAEAVQRLSDTGAAGPKIGNQSGDSEEEN